MRIYFCGSILGGRSEASTYGHIIGRLQAAGHLVPTAHVADPDVLEAEQNFTPGQVFERDMTWLNQAQAMIAEVSTPSLGVGYEIACGLQRGIQVLCLYREGLQVSKMITGNGAHNLHISTYRDLISLDLNIDEFLRKFAVSPGDNERTANATR
jgi:2'-deoxynucleoside 5'-phosphate N-hydrolase